MNFRPQGNLFEDRPMTPRGEERVHEDTGTGVEGAPAEEDLDAAQVRDQVDDDPEAEPNYTEQEGLDADDFTDSGGAGSGASTDPSDPSDPSELSDPSDPSELSDPSDPSELSVAESDPDQHAEDR